MSTQAHDQQKAASDAAATPQSSQFQSRPFEASVNSAFTLPTNQFQSRPFAAPAQQVTPDIQAQLEQAQRFNYDLSEINLFSTGTTPPEPPSLAQPTSLMRTPNNPDNLGAATVIQRDEEGAEDVADQKAEEIYDALDWGNDEETAIQALSGHNQTMRSRIQDRFQSRYDFSLRFYLKDQLDGDWLVKAIALLDSSHTHDLHTAMALALIPLGTRDEEILRILNSLPLSGRQTLEERYNSTFFDIGEGSLKADIDGDLSGWSKEKSLALLHRDLTSADHLYFDSVAITGTHTESVISRIQSEWDRGPSAFASFEQDWDQYVRNQAGWTDEAWTDESLYDAMDGELSGEEWEVVSAILRGLGNYQEQVGVEVGSLSEEQLFQQEDIRLQVAQQTLTAATTGGYTGAGTNEAQVFRAVQEIHRIWQERIRRAELAGDTQRQQDYEQRWTTRRQDLMVLIPDEMDTEGSEYQRVRLLTMGNLNLADEVYLADQDLDNDRIISLVTQYWAKGQINDLLSQAEEPRTDESGATIRPAFEVTFLITSNHGIQASRVFTLTRADLNDAGRGARRLKLELDEGDSDSDLRRGYELLTMPDISAGLRNAVIQIFAEENLSQIQGDSPTQKFLNYIVERYENSTTCYDFQDLLEPATDPQQMVERARGRHSASQSGWFDAALTPFVWSYDALSGEDTEEVVEESLDRLEFIAEQTGARPEELEAMLAMTGASDRQALASLEYTAFRARLEELRQLKRSITEAIAMTVEIVVEVALTVATGGAAAGALLASLSSSIAGMVLREALLGQDYDLISRQNAQQLVTAIASHGFGSMGRGFFADVINPENLQQLSRARAFMGEALTEAFTQANVQVITAGFEGRYPTTEDIAARILSSMGSTLGAGSRGILSHGFNPEQMAMIERLRHSTIANITQNVISGVSEEGAELVRTGTGDLTGTDIAFRFGRRTAQSVGRGLTSGIGEVGGQEVASRRQAARDRQLEDHTSGTETPEVPHPDGTDSSPEDTELDIRGGQGTSHDTEETPASPRVPRSPGSEDDTDAATTQPMGDRSVDLERAQAVRDAVEHMQLPEATVVMPPERQDSTPQEQLRYVRDAQVIYQNSWRGFSDDSPAEQAAARSKEVALYRNTQTGEFIIIQGNDQTVYVEESGTGSERQLEAPGGAGVAQRWKEILDGQDVGHWALVAHSHPVDPNTGVVADRDRFPSGSTGDMGVLIQESDLAGGQPRSSRINYETAEGPNHTDFGYNPSASNPFWINFPDPNTGQRQRLEFPDLAAYHTWMRETFGIDMGAVPESMRRSESVSDAATTDAADTLSDTASTEESASGGGNRPLTPDQPNPVPQSVRPPEEEPLVGRSRPESPIEPPRDANGQIDFDAWEARLREKGVRGLPDSELVRKINEARAGNQDTQAELRLAERYADAGYEVEIVRPTSETPAGETPVIEEPL
ncbi:MAG: hypothetical protein F6K28_13745, partial [Microcoleus sp. SIO2G3]|nr:hypothetical protein [Microcoleus sp. SIO2G3]